MKSAQIGIHPVHLRLRSDLYCEAVSRRKCDLAMQATGACTSILVETRRENDYEIYRGRAGWFIRDEDERRRKISALQMQIVLAVGQMFSLSGKDGSAITEIVVVYGSKILSERPNRHECHLARHMGITLPTRY